MTHPGTNDANAWRLPLAIALLLVAAVYAPTLTFGFVNWDDFLHIWENPAVHVTQDTTAKDLLLTPSLGYPIPVTALSNRVEFALVGKTPWLYHLDNVLLHLAACALLFALARKLGLDPLPAACAVLLFGLHPSTTEPVSWVSGRKDLLALTLALAALLAALHDLDHPDAPTRRRALAPTLFALALLAKPVALFVLPLHAFAALKRLPPPDALKRLLPTALVAAAIVPLAFLGQQERGALEDSPLLFTLRKAWFALGAHLQLLTLVEQPCVKHFPPDLTQTLDLYIDPFPLLALPLLVLAALKLPLPRHRPAAAFGLAFATFAYLPNSNLIPLVRFIADTYIHAPLAGVALIASAALQRLQLLKHRLAPLFLLALALPLAALALPASAMWRDDLALWGEAFRRYEGQHRDICMTYGAALVKAQRYEDALHVYQTCEDRQGPFIFTRNIALMHLQLNDPAGARLLLLKLQAHDPDDPIAAKYLPLLLHPPTPPTP